ncbi:MAG: bifunctional UDP-N-acetylmuramoyl-tripeptide:D-alanyl-D-alanine ligase/alanine racemase [Bacteroidales bacterium]|nr:bifunctional UDP-N-acetylmuramoyl-tripeptide:D-alanyl-D-alanine ligase/alanine racemase [Bacteroidales bacterium]
MNNCISIKDIIACTSGSAIPEDIDTGKSINNFITDSRQLVKAENTIFIAIKTKRNDGHKYIPELIAKGVKYFLIDEKWAIENKVNNSTRKDITYIVVSNTIEAFQNIAAFYRKRLTYPIIGITGSNGKTVVKEWLWQILSAKLTISRSPKSFNSQIGVPLSIVKMNTNSQLGIIEAGISETGEMKKLEKIILPDIGIITNVNTAHIYNFKDKAELIAEKIKLFENSNTIIYCAEHEDIASYINHLYPFKRLIGWRYDHIKQQLAEINLQDFFADKASLENIGHCITLINYLGYNILDFKKQLSSLSPIEMRLEYKNGINNCQIIDDSYSLDINSLSIAIDVLCQQNRFNKRTLILSDFPFGDNQNSEIIEIINNKPITKVILIGKIISAQKNLFNCEVRTYENTDDFIKHFESSIFHDEAILIKGARDYNFENISQLLQEKEHETVLEVNVDSLINNLNTFKSLLKPETKMLVMVKAFSYGTGSVEIADILQSNSVDYLAVAFIDEGVELRDFGIKLPIVVMNPETMGLNVMIKYDLEPEIYSFKRLEQFIAVLQANKTATPYPIHIKIDTGMHRLGFSEADIDELNDKLNQNKNIIKVSSIFSHLACADNSSMDDFTLKQIKKLQNTAERIEEALGYKIIKHILNSSGIVRFNDYQMDMVRLGIGLYGAEETLMNMMNLEMVLSLKSVVSQIQRVPKGEGIGYGQTWIAPKDSKIAIIPIGYADGFSLRLSNSNTKVYINNNYAPLVGRICMDMCFIDVSGLEVKEGDEVEIFGQHASLYTLAKNAETIPYEIISTLSHRIKRIYYR